MQNDKQTLKFLIMKWFYNVLNNGINDEILFLETSDDSIKTLILTSLSKNIMNNSCVVINDREYIDGFFRHQVENIIMYQSMNREYVKKTIGFQMFLNQTLLLVPEGNEFYSNTEQYINSNNFNQIDVSKKERYLYYSERVDPFDLIQHTTGKELESFLNLSIERYIKLDPRYGSRDVHSYLCNKTTFKYDFMRGEVWKDISLYNEFQVLTSRLAVIVYRVAQLKIKATMTEVGRYFHKMTGAKSKTYNYKLIFMNKSKHNVDISESLMGKNFKAYDLSVNESEMVVRKEIVKNLIQLKKYDLDEDTISKATNVPVPIVNNMIQQYK